MLDTVSRRSKASSVFVSDIRQFDYGGYSFAVTSEEETLLEDRTRPWRVFINHIDSYHAEKVTDLLLKRQYVPPPPDASSNNEEGMDEEENEEQEQKEDEAEGEQDEEEEEEEEEYRGSGDWTKSQPPRKFELIATALQRKQAARTYSDEDVKVILPPEDDREKFISEILKCGFIIYDITQDESQIQEANWVLDELERVLTPADPKARKSPRQAAPRHFILISTIMTWARSKPVVTAGKSDEEEAAPRPLNERDYRKRRAHPHFKEYIACERKVVATGKKLNRYGLRVLVLCCGVSYGEEEAMLHYLFKLGWHNEPSLPVIGAGENLVPLLHVRDLASAVYVVIREWPKPRYIVAVERGTTSQKNLVKAISKSLTTGKIKFNSAEDALLLPEVTQAVVDAITCNLNIVPTLLAQSKHMQWQSELDFVPNIPAIVNEYRESRNLIPIKLTVLGPPGSGKTTLARELASHYKLHYVDSRSLVADTVQQLANEIEDTKDDGEEEFNEENEEGESAQESDDAEVTRENLQELLDQIRNGLAENNGILNDDLLTKVFRRKLLSKECQNQGYVIDGYPKTLEQATLLFGTSDLLDQSEGEIEEQDEAEGTVMDPKEQLALLPDLVIALEASDQFLMDRMFGHTERELQNANYTEERFLERLRKYRERNDENNTPLQLFDELEIHPIVLDVEEAAQPDATVPSTRDYCLGLIGPPRNYGPSPEELAEQKRLAEAEAAAAAALAEAQRQRELLEQRRERERRAIEWTELLERLKLEEEEQLYLTSEPLRHYLVSRVFPTLTLGLVEVTKLRPDEPIDYLAEYLFKANPAGRPLEPDYTEELCASLGSLRRLQLDGILELAACTDVAFQHALEPAELQSCRCCLSSGDRSEAEAPSTGDSCECSDCEALEDTEAG